MNSLLPMLVCTAVLLLQSSLTAQDSIDQKAIEKALKCVSPLELPSTASSRVAGAAVKNKEAVAVAVVTVALRLNAPAAPAIVGAIIRGNPSVASSVVATATQLQPDQAELIKTA